MGEVMSKLSHWGGPKCVSEYTQTDRRTLVHGDTSLRQQPVHTPDLNLMRRCNLLDPRSATQGIVRTPLILAVENGCETPKNTTTVTYVEDDGSPEVAEEYISPDHQPSSNQLPQEAMMDIERQESSGVVPALNETDEDKQEAEEETRSDKTSEECDDGDDTEDEEEEDRQRQLEERRRALKKKLFFTPEPQKTCAQKPLTTKSGRTPLGIVCHNRGGGSGWNDMDRGWKVMSEERARLGLENTPPHARLPPIQDKVFSSPSRKMRHSRAHWDTDTTLII